VAAVVLEENINPSKATRLPLMFAIDEKLSIVGGNHYNTKQMLLHRSENSSCGGVACSGQTAMDAAVTAVAVTGAAADVADTDIAGAPFMTTLNHPPWEQLAQGQNCPFDAPRAASTDSWSRWHRWQYRRSIWPGIRPIGDIAF